MTDISSQARLENLFPELSARNQQQQAAEDNQELGKTQFLELMIAQLENQDPLAPKENGEFIAQLAQFSSVEGINNRNDSMAQMAGSFQSSVALQASSLVGRQVVVPASSTEMTAGQGIEGNIELEQSTGDLQVTVLDSSGRPVRTIAYGAVEAGSQGFAWDGRDADGNPLPAGTYEVRAEARDGNQTLQVPTQLTANVDSVTVGAGNTIVLNLAGAGSVPVTQVAEFK